MTDDLCRCGCAAGHHPERVIYGPDLMQPAPLDSPPPDVARGDCAFCLRCVHYQPRSS